MTDIPVKNQVNKIVGELNGFNMDGWGEVVNGPSTFECTAGLLRQGRSVIMGWTDEQMSHFDILFTYNPVIRGNIQGGLNEAELAPYIFVSIMRLGAFAFKVKRTPALSPDYIAEKLGLAYGNATSRKLATLVNGVIRELI